MEKSERRRMEKAHYQGQHDPLATSAVSDCVDCADDLGIIEAHERLEAHRQGKHVALGEEDCGYCLAGLPAN